jgi:pyridoxal phosphate enzyme (YggS family)
MCIFVGYKPVKLHIAENISLLKQSIPGHVQIVAVSKMQQLPALEEAYDTGQRMFGENKVQELLTKRTQLPSDIAWHFIGHLQTNKVKHLAPFISLIHGVDSIQLLAEINKEAKKHNRVIDCLLQFFIATEESKYGMDIGEAALLLDSNLFMQMNHVRIAGVMGMASFSDNPVLVRREFKLLQEYYDILKDRYFRYQETFGIRSMGMSGDFRIAIEEGSNMVRLGTSIFGDRLYG